MSVNSRRLTWAIAVTFAATLFAPPATFADENDGDPGAGCVKNLVTGECYGKVDDDDASNPSGSTAGKRSQRTPTCLNRAFDPPKRVPCTSKDGIWVQELSCYVKALDPQPAKDHPVWGGRADGAVYRCVVSQPYYRQSYIWLATAPTVRVDPEVLAERAVRSMGLRRVAVGLAPKPGPASYGLVGAPVYMWVADAGPQTTGPQSLSVSAGGVTVTVEARVQQVVWQMGDGATVTCRGAGTPYQDSYGSRPSPTCGHRYERPSDGRPGGVYPVTATTYWHVDWAGGGESGFFEFTFSTPTTVRITEAQALVS